MCLIYINTQISEKIWMNADLEEITQFRFDFMAFSSMCYIILKIQTRFPRLKITGQSNLWFVQIH